MTSLTRLYQVCAAVAIIAVTGLAGCGRDFASKTVRLGVGEVRIPERTAVSKVRLKTGEYLPFDTSGGIYHQMYDVIFGVTASGTREYVKMKDVDSVHFTITGDSVQGVLAGPAFREVQKVKYRDTIRGYIRAVITRQEEIEFNKEFGKIDSLNFAVVGISKYNTPVNIPLDSVYALRVERGEETKAMAAIVGGTILFGAYAYALHEGWHWHRD